MNTEWVTIDNNNNDNDLTNNKDVTHFDYKN